MMCSIRCKSVIVIVILIILCAGGMAAAQGSKPLTPEDMMKFKTIRNPVISDNGRWIAYAAVPGRGDGKVVVQNTRAARGKRIYEIERGNRPVFSPDSRWVAAGVQVPFTEREKKKSKAKSGMILLNTETGVKREFERVERYVFTNNSRWLAIKCFEQEKEEEKGKKGEKREKKIPLKKGRKAGTELTLYDLQTGKDKTLPFVHTFAFDSSAHYLAYAITNPPGDHNSINCIDLADTALAPDLVDFDGSGYFSGLVWNQKHRLLTYVASVQRENGPDSTCIVLWDPASEEINGVISSDDLKPGWILPEKNALQWTRDGRRLFFGMKPVSEMAWLEEEKEEAEEDTAEAEVDPYDREAILEGRGVDVWHWNDPTIIPQQKKEWNRRRDKTYRAVYHLGSNEVVPLSDQSMESVDVSQNGRFTLGRAAGPYRQAMTWEGRFADVYLVDLENGSRKQVASRLSGRCYLSPQGGFIVYYRDRQWYLYDTGNGTTRKLTHGMGPFFNEDHDYPSPPPGYGLAGWTAGDGAVLIYDKYDIFQFSTATGEAINITGGTGRKEKRVFRVQRMDRDRLCFHEGEELLLTGFDETLKNTGFYTAAIGVKSVKAVYAKPKKYRFLSKAKKAGEILFTRESYTEFPDLWICGKGFKSPRKISDVNPQIKDFAWGRAELVTWHSTDGKPLQGVIIKPDSFKPGNPVPVLVYYYRIFSHRLHEFNEVVVNHRPCFPYYASNGYGVFLPDIKFDVGQPGFSATKCIVPGVQKLIDMGIADPKGVALHGHSWSGYQTAFVITQTDLFACAIAGAPVSNMTSAYSGIRYGSGMARQYQYEQSQSRLGGSLWEVPEKYIENSPVFFADRIHTPLLIMFGDEDGAVPWTQGVELYLAMRRLKKDCVFLQYRGEPHHPQKLANKLDYTIRMKAYLDTYCKGFTPPDWISKGIPYRGE